MVYYMLLESRKPLGPAPTSSSHLGSFTKAGGQSTVTISTSTAVGSISISTEGTYIVYVNVTIKVPSGGPVFANIVLPSSTGVGFSFLFGASTPYYQTANSVFYVTHTGSYTLPITIEINPSQVSLVTQAFLDYSYIRIA